MRRDFRFRAASIFCILLMTVVGVISCNSGAWLDPVARPAPSPELRTEVETLQLPGVAPEIAALLKAELQRVLAAKASAKNIATPPNELANQITDLAAADNGLGGVTLTWSHKCIGDYDQNGEVNVADLTPIGLHFGDDSAASDWASARLADGDGNGEVNIGDVTPIGMHFLDAVVSYSIYSSLDGTGYPLDPCFANGAGAEQRVTVQMADGIIGPAQFKVFEADVEAHASGCCYWVRPLDSQCAAGTASNRAMLGIADTLWQSAWGLDGFDVIHDVAVAGDGSVFAVGAMQDPAQAPGHYQLLLLKLSPDGELDWVKSWTNGGSDSFGAGIEFDENGDFIVAGSTDSGGSNDRQFLLQKWDTAGGLAWSYTFGLTGFDTSTDLAVYGADSFLTGMTTSYTSQQSIFIGRFDGDGGLTWARCWMHGTVTPQYDPVLTLGRTTMGLGSVFVACAMDDDMKLALLDYANNGNYMAGHTTSFSTSHARPIGLKSTFNRYTLETKLYLGVWLEQSGADGVFVTGLTGDYEPLFAQVWKPLNGFIPRGFRYMSGYGIAICGSGPGINAAEQYGYLCSFGTDDGAVIASEYLSLLDEQVRLNGVQGFSDGMLLWGYAPHAQASWTSLTGTTYALVKVWNDLGACISADPGAVLDSQPGSITVRDPSYPAGGAGYDDAFLTYRGNPE